MSAVLPHGERDEDALRGRLQPTQGRVLQERVLQDLLGRRPTELADRQTQASQWDEVGT